MNEIALRRQAAQGLDSAALKTPADVVRWLTAVQAQDYAGAKWSIGLRLPGSSDAIVEQAIADKAIIRTWAMRGTLHFVAAADVHWLLALLAPRIITRNARRYGQLDLDAHTLARSSELLAQALGEGAQMDREGLRTVLENEGISTTGQRIFYMLQRASLEGLIGQGIAIKNKPTFFALPAPPNRQFDRDHALAELASRYFTSHGPATVEDYIWWSGLPAAEAKAGLAAAKSLVSEEVNDRLYWQSHAPPETADHAANMLLLPPFDSFLLSYRDRSASIEPRDMAAWSQGKAMFSPSIVQRGKVVGLWRRSFKGKSVVVSKSPFRPFTAAEEDDLAAAAAHFSRFLGLPLILD